MHCIPGLRQVLVVRRTAPEEIWRTTLLCSWAAVQAAACFRGLPRVISEEVGRFSTVVISFSLSTLPMARFGRSVSLYMHGLL